MEVMCWVGERIDMFREREEGMSETLCGGEEMVFFRKATLLFLSTKVTTRQQYFNVNTNLPSVAIERRMAVVAALRRMDALDNMISNQ